MVALPPAEKKSRKVKMVAMIAFGCIALGGGLALLVKKNRADLQAQLEKNAAIEKAEQEAKNRALGLDDAADQTDAAQTKPARPAPNPTPSPKPGPVREGDVPVFGPMDSLEARKLGEGSLIRLSGTLLKVQRSYANGIAHFRLHFEGAASQQQMLGVAFDKDFKEKPNAELFKPFVKREIIIEGITVHPNDGSNVVHVKFTDINQIKMVGK